MTVFLCSHEVTLPHLGALCVHREILLRTSPGPYLSQQVPFTSLQLFIAVCLCSSGIQAGMLPRELYLITTSSKMKDFPWVWAQYPESRGVTSLGRFTQVTALWVLWVCSGAWAPRGVLCSPCSRNRHQALFWWIHPHVHAGCSQSGGAGRWFAACFLHVVP